MPSAAIDDTINPGEHERIAADARRLAAIVECSDDAIISKDLHGIITSWNDGARRLFGYTEAEAIGRYVTMLIPEDHADEEPMIISRILKGERVDHYETERRHKDGHVIDISLSVSPLKDAAGRIVGASKIARDISERKRHEAALRDADRRKDEFLAMLGHELRNPLAPLRNIAAIMQRRSRDTAGTQLAAMLQRQVEHMTRLIDDLLDVGRITQGKIELDMHAHELMAVIARAIEVSRPNIKERQHRLGVALPRAPLRVCGDMTRLVQMYANLLNNAARYTPEGGEIVVEAEQRADDVIVRIRDNGVGIAPDVLPHIFELFTQGERSLERSAGGLGIGLTVALRIARLHDGSIEAASEGTGRGSTFTVTLPLYDGNAAQSGAADEAGAIDAPPVEPRRVLVVDDNADAAESLAALLELGDHETAIAGDGPRAVEMAQQGEFDLILLDLGLPAMNGYEVARTLRAQRCTARLVALTGYGTPGDRQRTKAAGFDEHLVKPVAPDVLDGILRRC